MITEVLVKGLKNREDRLPVEDAFMEVFKIVRGEDDADTIDADFVRVAHKIAAAWLEQTYPGQWNYAYGDLVEGVTAETPGVVVSYHVACDASGDMIYNEMLGKFEEDYSAPYIEGVTDIDLIKDGGFTGQFHWNDVGIGGYVPAAVEITDPEAEAERERLRAVWIAEANAAKAAFDAKIALLPPFAVIAGKEQEYAEWVANQREDGYSGAAVNYGENWARLMQKAIEDGYTPEYFAKIAEKTSHEADVVGITGNMYGWAVNMLAHFWSHGEMLRVWHNKQYDHEGDGVVNPAVITLEVPGDDGVKAALPALNEPSGSFVDDLTALVNEVFSEDADATQSGDSQE